MTARADPIDLALEQAGAERSLHEFFRQSWRVTTPGYELCDGWWLEAIAAHLEAVILGELDDLLILVPPRCGKTLLTSICLPAWAWIHRPTTAISLRVLRAATLQPTFDGLPPPYAIALVSSPLGAPLELRRR